MCVHARACPAALLLMPRQDLLQSFSPINVFSTSNCQSTGIDWVDTFMTPWDKFPEELMQSLEKRPRARMRWGMVRIVVCEIVPKLFCISKRKSTEVANKIVPKYTQSLPDIIGGDMIGPGNHSLKQQQNRMENVKRSPTPKI